MSRIEVLHSSESNEWYTPKIYIDAARYVLGGTISLDPASCPEANKTVQANCYHTKGIDGLLEQWYGTVWLNPPYGKTNSKSNQEIWGCKLVKEYKSSRVTKAILLVNAATDTKWFHLLMSEASAMCLTNHRIAFINSEGQQNQPTHGNAFFYFGPYLTIPDFERKFSDFGRVFHL
jgi:ParB family chromosome partitioning protein